MQMRERVTRPFAPWLRFFTQSPLHWLTATFLVALSIRMVVVAAGFADISAPSADHNLFGWEMGWTARSLALGQGFSSPFLPVTGPTALVPPLYPYLLAGIFKLFGIYTPEAAFTTLGLNALFSSLTCIPVFFFTRNALDSRAARIASFAWAIYPFAVYFSAGRVWDYALTSLLFSCCLVAAQKLHLRSPLAWLGFGALYGVTALSNPSIVSLLPVFLLIAIYKVWRVRGAWFRKGLLASVAFTAVCLPWMVHTDRAMHQRFFLRDGFWLEFYAGNDGNTFNSNDEAAHPASNPAEMQQYLALGETAYIAQKGVLAKAWVSHHKLFFAGLCVRRAVRFWTGFWSFGRAYLADQPFDLPNVPFCLFLTWAMLRGIRRWWRDAPGTLLPFLCAVVVFPLPYYLSHSSADYRQPIEPIIVLLVTVGLFGTGAVASGSEDREAQRRALAAVV